MKAQQVLDVQYPRHLRGVRDADRICDERGCAGVCRRRRRNDTDWLDRRCIVRQAVVS